MLQLLVLATAPVWALLTYFYVRDIYEKEPRSLLMRVFIYGALVTFIAGYIGIALITMFGRAPGSLLYLAFENFVIVALVEEALKFAVVMLLVYRHAAFNEPYDGMLYAITASLGFAALENILYVARGGVSVAILRALLSVPAHALFGAAMGYYVGRAKFARGPEAERGYLRLALLTPVLLHGTFNFLLSTGQSLLVAAVVPFSIGMWVMALRQVRSSHLRSPFRPR